MYIVFIELTGSAQMNEYFALMTSRSVLMMLLDIA